jgi:hypothetical protein
MSHIKRRVYKPNPQTSLIFTDIIKDKGPGGVTLSIITEKLAQSKRLHPAFAEALETAVKALAKGKAA